MQAFNLINDRVFILLSAFNVLSAIVIFFISSGITSGDQADYLNLASSIAAGEFSSFSSLENHYPNNIRTPGYPLFISLVLLLFKELIAVKIAQLILYFISLCLWVRILLNLQASMKTIYIFLVLTGLSIQVSYYSSMIMSETLTLFFISAISFCLLNQHSKHFLRLVIISILLGCLVLIKPVFIFLPFIFIPFFAKERNFRLSRILVATLLFFTTLSPWIIWNVKNHNIATPLSAQGSSVLLYTSFWASKLPGDFKLPKSMFAPIMYDDLFNPFYYLYTNKNKMDAKSEFLREIDEIHFALEKHLSPAEKRDIAIMDSTEGIFNTYPSQYVKHRDQLFMQYFLQNIYEEPFYYIGTRIYNFNRLFFAGINPSIIFNKEVSLVKKLRSISIFGVTFFLTFLTFAVATFFILKNYQKISNEFLILYSTIIYTIIINVPFPVQSRYSVPIHLIIIFLFSIFISDKKLCFTVSKKG